MGYGSFYHVQAWRRIKPEVFWYIVTFRLFMQNKVGKIFVYMFWGVFYKTIILFAFVGYEMIIANSAL